MLNATFSPPGSEIAAKQQRPFATVSGVSVAGKPPIAVEDLVRLRQARDQMDRAYARPLDVPALARKALMSTGHFARQFRSAYGETPYQYLMTRRIERAMALLRRGDLSVTEVCMAVGCTSLGSFSSRFTELVGESPSAYRPVTTVRPRTCLRACPNGGPARSETEKRGRRRGE